MNVQRSIIATTLLLLVIAADASAQRRWEGRTRNGQRGPTTSRSDGAQNFSEDYEILTQRNIFLRDRRTRDTDSRPRTAVPMSPEQTFVLTGIVLEDGEYHAYLEDVTHRTVQRMTVSSPIARGKISGIEIDAIAYEQGGQTTWVSIGSNLTGSKVDSVSDARVTAAAQGGGGATPDPNDPNLSMEERMRVRRMQQLNPAATMPAAPTVQPNDQPSEDGAPPEDQTVEPAPPPPGTAAPAPEMSLEEQMRLRRAQEQSR